MPNYNKQPKPTVVEPYIKSDLLISQYVAYLIRQELDGTPRESIAKLVLASEDCGVLIEFDRINGLMPDYDEIVGNMWIDAASDNPLHIAFAGLVARSIPIELVCDGR